MKKLLFILTLFLVACKSNNKENNEFQSEALKQFEASVDSLVNESINPNEPGIEVLVAYDSKMLIGKGYGIRNLETKEPITKSTNMEMGSVSKQFTALAILSLVDAGKLSLEDKVYKFFPFKSFEGVTVKQLINHTSGMDDAEEAFSTEWDSTKITTNNDILTWYRIKNRKINTPGTAFKYNNGAYEILPLIVEKVSGEKYEAYIKEHVFKKAGLNRTIAFNLNSPVDINERAFYYHKDSLGRWNKMDGHPLTGVLGAGGIYTNINDYFNYDNALRKKSIFSKEIHQLIFEKNDSIKTDRSGTSNLSYAMGWFVNDSIAEHSGSWFGVNTYTKRYLKKPLTIAIFANRDNLSKKLISKLDSISVQFVNNKIVK
jgi:CubicO group peptidase (beta-lactamase class C family)